MVASDVANLGQGGGPSARSKTQSLGLTPVSMDEAAKMCGVSKSAISEFRAIKDGTLISQYEDRHSVIMGNAKTNRTQGKETRTKARPTGTNGGAQRDEVIRNLLGIRTPARQRGPMRSISSTSKASPILPTKLSSGLLKSSRNTRTTWRQLHKQEEQRTVTVARSQTVQSPKVAAAVAMAGRPKSEA